MSSPNNYPRTKLPPTVWNKIEAEAKARAARGQNVIALHVGDTHLPISPALAEPIEGEEKLFGDHLNRYSDTFGDTPLRELLLLKALNRNRLPVTGIDCVQVTGGATGALEAGFSRLLDPGAEVLVPAPYWSILRQVADQAKVKLVEVPFFDRMAMDRQGRLSYQTDGLGGPSYAEGDKRGRLSYAGVIGGAKDGGFDPAEVLEHYITPRTQGIYINTPSNPTGMLLDKAMLARIGEFAVKHDLWIFSDEAYEDYIWEGGEHVSIGSLPGMFERTISIHTCSKCFGASGIRIGYAVAEPSVVSQLNRGVVGGYYQPGRLGQLFAWRGMMRFEQALSEFRRDYEPTWRWTKNHLKMETLPCSGGFYFFVRLPSGWEGLTPELKIERMLDAGAVLSPGEYFGHEYKRWARLCFTVVPPAELEEAVQRLNHLLA